MNIVPKADFPRFFRTATKKSAAWLNQIESLIAFVDTAHIAQLDDWPHGGDIRRAISERPHAAGSVIQCMLPGAHPILLIAGILSSESTPYADLTLAARLIKALAPFRPSQVGILAAVEASRATRATDALVSALLAATEEHPAAKREPTPRWRPKAIRLTSGAPSHTVAVEQGAHTARWLTMLPPNVLYPGSYRKAVDAMARKWGWSVETFDERRLRRLGAGAFLAVSAGSARRDAAIVRISYRPKNSARRQAPIALVGKGLCFDTGGHNLKSAGSMLNMHADMAGSAVALGTLISLSEARHPYPVDVWLALAENRIGPDAYTQQDVITALDGTSIQIVHTDAEGRMVLADTLALVARSRPAAVVDFATLTGACVSALTERLSGFFTNVPTLRDVVEAAGRDSGERMHGFPMPDDFDEDLDSPTADVSQCLIGGKGDHIYAARFLSRFIPKGLPWVHCDLSSAERTGGLAHVPHTITGFGVRFAVTLLESAAFRQAIDTKESRS